MASDEPDTLYRTCVTCNHGMPYSTLVCEQCGSPQSHKQIKVIDDPDAPPNEHQRLADAASKLVDAIYPDFVGDLPAALEAMADRLGSSPIRRAPLSLLSKVILGDAIRSVSRV